MHAVKLRQQCADLIGLTHQFSCEASMRRLQFALFLSGGVNANPERFSQYQQIVSTSGIILFEMRSRHSPGDGEAKNGFGRIDAVPPSKREAQLRADIPTTLYYLIGDLGCQRVNWPS